MYLQKITQFIEEYLDVPDDWHDRNGNIMCHLIGTCVSVLIDHKVFTKQEMLAEAAKCYDVIIADCYFAECNMSCHATVK